MYVIMSADTAVYYDSEFRHTSCENILISDEFLTFEGKAMFAAFVLSDDKTIHLCVGAMKDGKVINLRTILNALERWDK